MKKVELLSPAGSYDSFRAALNAGADAVYAGGQKFSARAYAENFSDDSLLKAIEEAHVFGKKVYLTLNTLIKEKEFSDLADYILPFYSAGLDGIIVQDMGVFELIRNEFPGLNIHASTQMAVTGPEGAAFLEKAGASRVVPARELSLSDIKEIRAGSGVEIECFVHGAMCYSVSGMCLLSSFIGCRSGNRGRCAQPCRLPYTVKDEKGNIIPFHGSYPLSMKDMNTLELLPQLIESGIASFKIEGRMKRAEYTAGTVSIYRKYIDLYYDRNRDYSVHKQDMDLLYNLFNRDGFNKSYYSGVKRSDMVARENRHSGAEEQREQQRICKIIKEKYIDTDIKLPVSISAVIRRDKPVTLEFSAGGTKTAVTGDAPLDAKSSPLTEGSVRKQICKTGGTLFNVSELDLKLDQGLFVPVQTLNSLRREGLDRLKRMLADRYRKNYEHNTNELTAHPGKPSDNIMLRSEDHKPSLRVLISTAEQLYAASGIKDIGLIYVPLELISSGKISFDQLSCIQAHGNKIALALPYFRSGKASQRYLESLNTANEIGCGFLVRNIEDAALLKRLGYIQDLRTDYFLYSMNSTAKKFFKDNISRLDTLPLELNAKEIRSRDNTGTEAIIYGYLPMMISRQCINNNSSGCNSSDNVLFLEDRKNVMFPVGFNCENCYNIIYNSRPIDLIDKAAEIVETGVSDLRIEFTFEDAKEIRPKISFFTDVISGKKTGSAADTSTCTRGHYNRGVE